MRYRHLLARTTARYLRVRPDGIEIAPDPQPRTSLTVQIFEHAPARTCYQNRRPVCRSLDGRRALDHPNQLCRDCPLRPQCTPQIRLSLLVGDTPYQLLLAFTSARNFLAYLAEVERRGQHLANVPTRIRIINHHAWGEVRFEITGREGGPNGLNQDETA